MKTPPKKHFLFLRRMLPLPQGEWGGLEKLMFDWFQRIDYQQVKVTIVVTTGWRQRFEEEAQKYSLPINVIEFSFFNFTNNYWQRFGSMFSLFKSLRPSEIVFFQAWYGEFNLADLAAAALKTGGKVYMHENMGAPLAPERSTKKYFGLLPRLGLWWHFQRGLINLRAYVCKSVLTVSRGIKDRYVSLWGYPSSRIAVTYHGIDTVRYFPSPATYRTMREKLKIAATDTVMITTGRFTKQKRLDRVIEACGVLCQEKKDLWLLMAGSGPLEAELRKLAESLLCRDRITFLGNLKDPADYLKMSDIFVLSSDNEGLSLSLLEAMATGLVCVSTDCPGSGEVIQHGVTGFLTDKSTEGVLDGIRKALRLSVPEKQSISQAAIRLISEKFEINKNVAGILTTLGIPCLKL